MSSLKQYISNNTKEFYSAEVPDGNYSFYFRALTAQLLWSIFLYCGVVYLVPIKGFLIQNAIALIFFGIVSFFWNVVKSHCPPWFREFLTGDLFFKIDNTKELNWYIAGLIFLNTIFIVDFQKLLLNFKKHE
jgi:hypothetical protein